MEIHAFCDISVDSQTFAYGRVRRESPFLRPETNPLKMNFRDGQPPPQKKKKHIHG